MGNSSFGSRTFRCFSKLDEDADLRHKVNTAYAQQMSVLDKDGVHATLCPVCESISQNQILAEKHRVGLGSWPVRGALMKRDPRVQTLDGLFKHAAEAGYDGVEMSFVQLKGWYKRGGLNDCEADGNVADHEFVEEVRSAAATHGVSVLGATYHITDGGEEVAGAPDFADADFIPRLSRRMAFDKKLGSGYVNFQIFLPPQYMQTPLAWRDDFIYLKKTVRRSIVLRDLCWQHGLNAYFETHIDQIGEDPVFFRKVLHEATQLGTLEVNGDLSHYLYRGWTKGADVGHVLSAVNHVHVTTARVHGDLSAETPNPVKDFSEGGPLRAQWDMILRTGPLSSRTICGATGPIHAITDTLDQDAQIVPMLRAIAAVKDGSTAHLAPNFNPFA